MKKIASVNKKSCGASKYVFIRVYEADLIGGGKKPMIEYWIIDTIRNLITGEYWFKRSRWNMFLTETHKRMFDLDNQ